MNRLDMTKRAARVLLDRTGFAGWHRDRDVFDLMMRGGESDVEIAGAIREHGYLVRSSAA